MFAPQVIDMQADLLVRLHEDNFRHILSNILTADRPDENMGRAPRADIGQMLVSAVANHVRAAEAYHVNADMSLLVQYAAEALDPTDKVDLSLAPTGCGIVRFDHPLPMTDVRGQEMLIHWLTWGPATMKYADGGPDETGIFVTYWNDLLEPDEVAVKIIESLEQENVASAERLKRSLGRWAVVTASSLIPGAELGAHTVQPPEDTRRAVLAEGDTPTAFTNPQRYAHALWLMLNQTITSIREEHLTGPYKRRAQRENLPAKVTVVSLRRTEGAREVGESHVEWSHRWLVRGHWRWQAHGPGRAERKRIWVNGFVKGPEGAPLKVSPKVYSLHR